MTDNNSLKDDTHIDGNTEEHQDNNETQEEVEVVEEEQEAIEDAYKRLLADFENYRRRMKKELEEAREYGKVAVIQDLLPVLDTLEMSLQVNSQDTMLLKGIQMVHQNFLRTLEEHHVKTFEPQVFEDFLPTHHDPVLVDNEGAQPGKVLEVVSKGFLFKNQVLRPSKVKVKKESS